MDSAVRAVENALNERIAGLSSRIDTLESDLPRLSSRVEATEKEVAEIKKSGGATLFLGGSVLGSSSSDLATMVDAQVCVPTTSGWSICGDGGLGGDGDATIWQAGLSVPYRWKYAQLAPLARVIVADPSTEPGIGTFTSVLGARAGLHFAAFELGVEGGGGAFNKGEATGTGWMVDAYAGIRLF